MGAALIARYPLGTYQAHRPNGQPDAFPDPVRVFSALVAAAGTGSTATQQGDRLAPSPDAVTALRWLEANPPTGIALPDRVGPAGAVTSYRQQGVIRTEQGRTAAKVLGRRVGDVVALNGSVAWTWEHDIPIDVRVTIDALCADVAYLGESDSPVVLEVGEATPTHVLDRAASAFSSRGERVRVVEPGRLDELEEAYLTAFPTRRPSTSADRHTGSEDSSPPSLPRLDHALERRYVPVAATSSSAPWDTAWVLPITRSLRPDEIVPWCVALHRTLAARAPEPSPAIITGRFAEGQRRPANRLALHYIDGSLAPLLPDPSVVGAIGAFVVSFPSGGATEDRAVVESTLRGLHRVYRREGELQLDDARQVDASHFWKPVAPGFARLWTSVTPLVPETRPQTDDGRRWTLADAARLSIAFVARDELERPAGQGGRRYRELVAAVDRRGVRVGRTTRIADSRVERYAHRLPQSVVAQPYHAVIDLGDLWDPQALVAAGQSRHLGGGLLAPLDVVPAMSDALMGAGGR